MATPWILARFGTISSSRSGDLPRADWQRRVKCIPSIIVSTFLFAGGSRWQRLRFFLNFFNKMTTTTSSSQALALKLSRFIQWNDPDNGDIHLPCLYLQQILIQFGIHDSAFFFPGRLMDKFNRISCHNQ